MMNGSISSVNEEIANDSEATPLRKLAAMRNLVNHQSVPAPTRQEWYLKYKTLQAEIGTTEVNVECPICLEPLESGDLHITMCNHCVHHKCFTAAGASSAVASKGFQCPLCKSHVSRPLSFDDQDNEVEVENEPLPVEKPAYVPPPADDLD